LGLFINFILNVVQIRIISVRVRKSGRTFFLFVVSQAEATTAEQRLTPLKGPFTSKGAKPLELGRRSTRPVLVASRASRTRTGLAAEGGTIPPAVEASGCTVSVATGSSAANFSTHEKGNYIISHLM